MRRGGGYKHLVPPGPSNVRATHYYPKHKCRNCGREVRHLVVNQADDGSSPFSSANASVAKLDQGTCLLSRGL